MFLVHQRISTRSGGLGNKRMSGDHPNYSIIEISQNTEKRLEETCCHTNCSEKLLANTAVKNSQRTNNNNNLYLFFILGIHKLINAVESLTLMAI